MARKANLEKNESWLVSKWKEPLFRVLEGHEDLLRITSEFPKLGKLDALISPDDLKTLVTGIDVGVPGTAASPIVAIVVVVVVVAVAARPGGVPNIDLLKAKLLDVYSPKEREVLHKAVKAVQMRPDLLNIALGINQDVLGEEFMKRLVMVEKALR